MSLARLSSSACCCRDVCRICTSSCWTLWSKPATPEPAVREGVQWQQTLSTAPRTPCENLGMLQGRLTMQACV